jgi:hypothetical protein
MYVVRWEADRIVTGVFTYYTDTASMAVRAARGAWEAGFTPTITEEYSDDCT